jgi:polar amino acid transport system substrate-binding protein
LFPPEEVANFYTLEKPLVDGAGLHLMTSKTYPDNAALLVRFNAAMAEVKSSGTYAQLVEKHGLTLRF